MKSNLYILVAFASFFSNQVNCMDFWTAQKKDSILMDYIENSNDPINLGHLVEAKIIYKAYKAIDSKSARKFLYQLYTVLEKEKDVRFQPKSIKYDFLTWINNQFDEKIKTSPLQAPN